MEGEKFKLKHLKSKLDDNKLDLSLCELTSVPVKEILDLKKVTELDLSRNRLENLPKDFHLLVNLSDLDLSSNRLESLGEDFGSLSRLQRLDLYKNELTDLPLSFCKLKQLKWLDLKGNPLNEQLRQVAGDFATEKDCRQAATKVLQYMQKRQSDFERERQKRLGIERERDAATKAKEEAERKLEQLEKKKQKDAKKKPVLTSNNYGKDILPKETHSDSDTNTLLNGKGVQDPKNAKSQQKKARRARRSCLRLVCNFLLTILLGTLLAVACLGALLYITCTQPAYANLLPGNSSALCDDLRHLTRTGELKPGAQKYGAEMLAQFWRSAKTHSAHWYTYAQQAAQIAWATAKVYFGDVALLFNWLYDEAARRAPGYSQQARVIFWALKMAVCDLAQEVYALCAQCAEWLGEQTRHFYDDLPTYRAKMEQLWQSWTK